MPKKQTRNKQLFDSNVQQNYTVRISLKAKHVRLSFSIKKGLEIVVPENYDQHRLPMLIESKQAWLNRVQRRLHQQALDLPDDYFSLWPTRIQLLAINQTYSIGYRNSANQRIQLIETDSSIILSGPVDDSSARVERLKGWLRTKARKHLAPWLQQTSRNLNLPYAKATIRSHKTRWGSCSSSQVISLNDKLLFLPPRQVEYLLVHELCHTRQMNHSRRYWALVAQKFPDYRVQENAMKKSWRFVPVWADS